MKIKRNKTIVLKIISNLKRTNRLEKNKKRYRLWKEAYLFTKNTSPDKIKDPFYYYEVFLPNIQNLKYIACNDGT